MEFAAAKSSSSRLLIKPASGVLSSQESSTYPGRVRLRFLLAGGLSEQPGPDFERELETSLRESSEEARPI
jgi:hypothetical protein